MSGRTSLIQVKVSQQFVHRVIHLARRYIVTWTRRVPSFVNGPVQLGFALLQCLQGPVLLQGHDNCFYVAVANDHLMIGNLVTNAQGMLTHKGQGTPLSADTGQSRSALSELSLRHALLGRGHDRSQAGEAVGQVGADGGQLGQVDGPGPAVP